MASDGNWYAPELHPDYVQPPTPPTDAMNDAESLYARETVPDPDPGPSVLVIPASVSKTGSHGGHKNRRFVVIGLAVLLLVVATVYITVLSPSKSSTSVDSIAVQPCQAVTHMLEHPPATQPAVSLYAPASGGATPQAVINDVIKVTNAGKGLLAECPYVTSQLVWSGVLLSETLGGTTSGSGNTAKIRQILYGDGKPTGLPFTVKITDPHCSSNQCAVTVLETTRSPYGVVTVKAPYTLHRYNGRWYVSGDGV